MAAGFTAVSLKRDLYEQVRAEAARQGRTPTNYVVWAIKCALGTEQSGAGEAR